MIIRKAKKGDIEGVYLLFLELFKSESLAAGKTAKFLKDLRSRRKDFQASAKKELLREVKTKNSVFLVAEENKTLIGYGYGSIHRTKDPFFKPKNLAYLNAVVVNKKFRSKGVGYKLYKELLKYFRKHECVAISLEVFANNSAVKLYEKWGYKISTYKMWKRL